MHRSPLVTDKSGKGATGTAISFLSGCTRAGWELVKAASNHHGLGRPHHLSQAEGMVRGAVAGLRHKSGPPPASLLRHTDISVAGNSVGKPTTPTAANQRSSPPGPFKALRIVEMITRLDSGGAQTHLYNLALELKQAGHDVRVFVGIDGRVADDLRAALIPVTLIDGLGRSINPLRDAQAYRQLRNELRPVTPDLLHLHSSKPGLLGRIAARRLRLPAVYTAHGWPFTYGPPIDRLLSLVSEWMAGRFLSTAIVCVSESDCARARRIHLAPADRLHLIPNDIHDIPESRRATPGVRLVPHIVMVARPAAPKDHFGAVAALAQLTDLRWRATFAGDGPLLEAVRSDVSRRGLAERIACPGDVRDIEQLLADADLFLLATSSEGNPISVLEAMRAGLPCVLSDLPQLRELLPESAAWFATSNDLATALRSALESGKLAAAGMAARASFEARTVPVGELGASPSPTRTLLEQTHAQTGRRGVLAP